MPTLAQQIIIVSRVNEIKAFEQAIDIALTVREASDYSVYIFADSSSVRIVISDEHEMTFIEE